MATTTTTAKGKKALEVSSNGAAIGSCCIICCEPYDIFSVGPCGHRDVCATCSFRRRQLYGQRQCSICKEEQPQVIFTRDPKQPYSALLANLSRGGGGGPHSNIASSSTELGGAICDSDDIRLRFLGLVSVECPKCPRLPQPLTFATVAQLKQHLRVAHGGLQYCDICLEDRKVFLSEQLLFKPSELPQHMREWDGGISESMAKVAEEQRRRSAEAVPKAKKDPLHEKVAKDAASRKWKPLVTTLSGHPSCRFCDVHFYGVDQLYDHLNRQHVTCPHCDKSGKLWQYYKNVQTLIDHYAKDHFLCHEPGCLLAFASAIDLRAHEVAAHGVAYGKKDLTIEANFRVRRAGRDGEGIDDGNAGMMGADRRRPHHGFGDGPSSMVMASTSMSSGGGRLEITRPARTPPPSHSPPRSISPPPSVVQQPSSIPASGVVGDVPVEHPKTPPPAPATSPAAPATAAHGQQGSRSTSPPAARATSPTTMTKEEKKKAKQLKRQQQQQKEEQAAAAQPSPQEEANAKLVSTMRDLVSDEEFRTFRQYSGDFRNGIITARDYHARFFSTFGTNAQTRKLFSDLVNLLPDQSKRMELLQIITVEQPPARPAPSRSQPPVAVVAALQDFPALVSDAPSIGPVKPLAPAAFSGPQRPQDFTANDFPELGGGGSRKQPKKTKTPPAAGTSSWGQQQQQQQQPQQRGASAPLTSSHQSSGKKGKTVLLKFG